MSPALGQGAGVGMQDAAVLTTLLAVPDLDPALALEGYANIRRPAAQTIQRISHAATRPSSRQTAIAELAKATGLQVATSMT